jgi:hypothetical protein
MRQFLRFEVWPVVAGLLTAFIVMTIFEFVNSFFYPLPEGLDIYDQAQVKAFTASLPWTAYILVFLGWVAGSFKAGCVTTYLAREEKYRLSFLVGILLTILGILNNMLIGHNVVFSVVALPMFILFTYLGHAYLRKTLAKRMYAKEVS